MVRGLRVVEADLVRLGEQLEGLSLRRMATRFVTETTASLLRQSLERAKATIHGATLFMSPLQRLPQRACAHLAVGVCMWEGRWVRAYVRVLVWERILF